ncbi:MAG: response regulator [Myxococcales bacterium]|nr:response regulator [Myxococcales bacterium]MDD9967882.1 response regulator [Myxococcales bacterium]
MRVLVVEDDEITRANIVRVLRSRGHHVTECDAAEPSLSIHTTMPFPLVMIDWVLPGMDGLELCRRIRALPGGESPVVLLATCKDKPEDLIAGLDAGADDYLTKPIEDSALTTRLAIAERTVLERARRELTEEALLSSEASFRALIEGSPDGIIAHRAGRIVYANPAILSLLGHSSPAELIGRPFIDLIAPEDEEEERRRIEDMLSSGEPSPARELRLRARNQTVATMEEVAIPLEFDGEPAVAAVFRDVAERKRMEQQLMMADRMVSVGTLAAGIAHEINNPLAYVLTNLSFIGEEVEEAAQALPPERLDAIRELLAQADDGAERVRVIVRDLKSFSRADDGSEATRDVHRVIDGSISMAWNEIRHRAQLVKRYGDLPAVAGSEARLGQVFLNLLVNAAQSLPVGQAADNRITVATRLEGPTAIIEFSDTGPGIPDDVKNRIFDPFFTTKPVGVGIGLGLSICHNIVSNAGGELKVSSTPGRGSTFTVVLPLAARPVAAIVKQLSTPPTPPPTGARILIVDDEPSVARALQRALRNHDVAVALSGREALQLLSEPPRFDIVFCDLMMADMSGMDLFAAVKERDPGMEDHFVFMTGGAFTERAKDFVATVDNQLLEKPFDIHKVQALVGERIRTPSIPRLISSPGQ